MISFTILGSGTCVPRSNRASPGFFLKIGNDKILLDCGSGTLRQLIKAGGDYKTIDLLIISHFHPDHASDLAPFLQALNYTPRFDRKKELKILAGEGFPEFFGKLEKLFAGVTPRLNTYEIRILKPGKHTFSDFSIETKQGNHSKESIIVKITSGGKSLVYTGDTDYDKKISKFAYQADLLITECSFPEGEYGPGHLNPSLAGKMAKEAEAKKLLLTHFYPPTDKVNIKNQVKQYFAGETILAKDLEKIILK